jgi:uncharacterized membrane protein
MITGKHFTGEISIFDTVKVWILLLKCTFFVVKFTYVFVRIARTEGKNPFLWSTGVLQMLRSIWLLLSHFVVTTLWCLYMDFFS